MANTQTQAGSAPAAKTPTPNRFDYVAYDAEATDIQKLFKAHCQSVERAIEELLVAPRAKALALTKLEELYMWIGKAVRDDQIARNGSAPLQEQRNHS